MVNKLGLQICGGKSVRVYLDGKELYILNNVCTNQICAFKVEKYKPVSLIIEEDLLLPANSYTAVKVRISGGKMKVGEVVEILPVDKLINNIYPNNISQVELGNMIIVLILNLSVNPLFFTARYVDNRYCECKYVSN